MQDNSSNDEFHKPSLSGPAGVGFETEPVSEFELKLPHTVFALDEVAPHEKFALWRESISFLFDVDAAKDIRNNHFEARVDTHMFGQFVLARTTSRQQIWGRNEQNIAKDGLGHFMLQVFEAGQMWYESQNDRVALDGAGIIVFDLSRTSQSWTNDFTNLSIILPRHLLEPQLRNPDDLHLRFFPARMPLVQLLIDHIKSLKLMADKINIQQAMEVNGATVSLVAACMNNMFDPTAMDTPNHDVALGMQARKLIEDSLHDPDFSAEMLAQMMTISRTRLYSLFKPYGGVRAYMQSRRLKHIFKCLVDPVHSRRSISEIAYSSGFKNMSAFSQIFKKTFGMSPSEARLNNSQYYLNQDPSLLADRRYEDWIRKI